MGPGSPTTFTRAGRCCWTRRGELRALAGGYGDRIKVITTAVLDETGPGRLLVRPDGFVAWAADTADTAGADPGSLEAALSTWLGAPAVAPLA